MTMPFTPLLECFWLGNTVVLSQTQWWQKMNPVQLIILPSLFVSKAQNHACLLRCKHFEGSNPIPIGVPQSPEQVPCPVAVLNSNLLYLGPLLEFVMLLSARPYLPVYGLEERLIKKINRRVSMRDGVEEGFFFFLLRGNVFSWISESKSSSAIVEPYLSW